MKCERCGGETNRLHNGICFDCAMEIGTLPNTIKPMEMKKCNNCGRETTWTHNGVCGICVFESKYHREIHGIGEKPKNGRPCVVNYQEKGIWHGWVKFEAAIYGIVETEDGNVYRVKAEDIKFLDTQEQMKRLASYFEVQKGKPQE